MNLSLTEIIITISAVLGLGITYTWIYYQILYKEMKQMMQAEQEYCPSSEDESEE
jgi:hypothetical protein